MDVSIIIVNYNTKALLKQCLLSIFEKTKDVAFEIIVVDNASSDGSPQMLKNDFSGVKLIESKENLGFGRANNLGAEQAAGKYLFLLNSDTILMNNAVKILFDFLENNSKTGICCGNLFDENEKPNHSYFMYLSPFIRELDLFLAGLPEKLVYGKNAKFNYTTQPKKIGDPTAADLMIRADLFRAIKGFDSDFFMYGEDRHLNYKVKKLNYDIYNIPQAKIIHLDGKSTVINVNRLLMIRQGTNLYYQKTQNRVMKFVCRSIFFLMICSRLSYFKLRGNKEKTELWEVLLKYEKKL
jgi:GT2 family glycosyltransferase